MMTFMKSLNSHENAIESETHNKTMKFLIISHQYQRLGKKLR